MILDLSENPAIAKYDIEKICTLFFLGEKIKSKDRFSDDEKCDETGEKVFVSLKYSKNSVEVEAHANGAVCKKADTVISANDDEFCRRESVLLYSALFELTGFRPPWGILFGVRPVKLMRRLAEKSGESEAVRIFCDDFLADRKKAELALSVMKRENSIISLSKNNSCSLYVSIPFCPTRCAYCSFVSHSVENAGGLIGPYTELLCKEIEETARHIKKLGLRLETIYFGGGTPTTLSADMFSRIFYTIEKNFDLKELREYTVEAGRPDTITKDKLIAMKSAGVGRISINPQTFNDNVLQIIGRSHSSKQTFDAYNTAVACGFKNINTDLISGLPGDSVNSFENSVDTAVSLEAASITIHALAMKSGAFMVTKNGKYDLSNEKAQKMTDYAYAALAKNGYLPYYMYRQSKSVGCLENVGWAKNGFECLYNVFMMDETHSVFAVGAGGVTRLKNPLNGKIARIYNFKYPYEYINRFDEMISRKADIDKFYIKKP